MEYLFDKSLYGPSPFSLMFSLLLNELSFTFYLLIGNALQRLSSLLAKILIKTYMKICGSAYEEKAANRRIP